MSIIVPIKFEEKNKTWTLNVVQNTFLGRIWVLLRTGVWLDKDIFQKIIDCALKNLGPKAQEPTIEASVPKTVIVQEMPNPDRQLIELHERIAQQVWAELENRSDEAWGLNRSQHFVNQSNIVNQSNTSSVDSIEKNTGEEIQISHLVEFQKMIENADLNRFLNFRWMHLKNVLNDFEEGSQRPLMELQSVVESIRESINKKLQSSHSSLKSLGMCLAFASKYPEFVTKKTIEFLAEAKAEALEIALKNLNDWKKSVTEVLERVQTQSPLSRSSLAELRALMLRQPPIPTEIDELLSYTEINALNDEMYLKLQSNNGLGIHEASARFDHRKKEFENRCRSEQQSPLRINYINLGNTKDVDTLRADLEMEKTKLIEVKRNLEEKKKDLTEKIIKLEEKSNKIYLSIGIREKKLLNPPMFGLGQIANEPAQKREREESEILINQKKELKDINDELERLEKQFVELDEPEDLVNVKHWLELEKPEKRPPLEVTLAESFVKQAEERLRNAEIMNERIQNFDRAQLESHLKEAFEDTVIQLVDAAIEWDLRDYAAGTTEIPGQEAIDEYVRNGRSEGLKEHYAAILYEQMKDSYVFDEFLDLKALISEALSKKLTLVA